MRPRDVGISEFQRQLSREPSGGSGVDNLDGSKLLLACSTPQQLSKGSRELLAPLPISRSSAVVRYGDDLHFGSLDAIDQREGEASQAKSPVFPIESRSQGLKLAQARAGMLDFS